MDTPFLPPDVPEPTGFFVRLNDQDGYRQRLLTFFESLDYTKVLCLRHEGDKDDPHSHYHFTVSTNVKKQAFRVRMKTAFPEGKGNGHMSIKEWDGSPDANSYMFHETEEHLVAIKGYGGDYLSFIRARSARVLAEVAKSKGKAAYHLIDLAYESLKDERTFPDERQVARRILQLAFKADKHIPTKFQMKTYVQKVQYRLCHGDVDTQDGVIESILDDYLG